MKDKIIISVRIAAILLLAAVIVCSGCRKAVDLITNRETPQLKQFTKYTIKKGDQYCDLNGLRSVKLTEMKFVVKFDSSAIYQTTLAENQYDINKLYGFSDNNSGHHQYSARFGWRWSDGALRLFAYVYNNGAVLSQELTTIGIGEEINCSIQVSNSGYVFNVNETTVRLPRLAATEKGDGYQLYPYFGGDEKAPHDISIWIKNIE